jgi:hypothetical protein
VAACVQDHPFPKYCKFMERGGLEHRRPLREHNTTTYRRHNVQARYKQANNPEVAPYADLDLFPTLINKLH